MRIPKHEFFGKRVDMHKCVPSQQKTEGDHPHHKVFVGGLDDSMTEEILREALSPFGKIQSVNVIRQQDGKMKGFGFVQFTDQAPVDMLLQRQALMVNGRRIFFGNATAKKKNQ